MSRREPWSKMDVQALLDSGKEVPRQPAAARERVLARARATAASPMVIPAQPPAARLGLPRYMVAPAAAAALAVGITGAVYALSQRWSRPQRSDPAWSATVVRVGVAQPSAAVAARSAGDVPMPVAAPARSAAEAEVASKIETTTTTRARRHAESPESYEAELRLMRSAHTDYAAHEFANALVLVGEHARRFPAGLLAEEREALRVRCLLGSGRTREAQRAAAAFATRFPRSVLLPRIDAEVGISRE